MRLLFSSIHCYLDPSSGAAQCTREMLELLAARGMDCRVLTTGVLDPERETTIDEVLATLELPAGRFRAELGSGSAAEVLDLNANGVRVTVLPTASSRAERSPDPREAAIFLELAEHVFDRFRPDVLLTYGGHPASLELMRRARQRGIAVVFHLHNFGYNDARAFADVSAVIFPSEYSRGHHARLLGLDGPVIPDPIPLDRIVAADPEPQYVTFINPQPCPERRCRGAAAEDHWVCVTNPLIRPSATFSPKGEGMNMPSPPGRRCRGAAVEGNSRPGIGLWRGLRRRGGNQAPLPGSSRSSSDCFRRARRTLELEKRNTC